MNLLKDCVVGVGRAAPSVCPKMAKSAALLFAVLLSPCWVARAEAAFPDHAILVPQAQKIQYGSGVVDVCRLAVKQANTSAEDRFAAQQFMLIVRSSCGSSARQHGPRKALIPVELVDEGQGAALPGTNDHAGPESRERYRISIQPNRVLLRGHSPSGLFYAVQTFRQMVQIEAGKPVVECAEIEDWPSLAYRGFMMDMSHGAVPTLSEVKRQLDFLSRWKGNQYYFYVETNLELKGYPLLGQGWSWSQSDIREIVEYARERHIDVVPCVEMYGHLHDLFSIERYASLGALPHGGELNPANPAGQALAEDWLRQIAALFPSKWLHVGFDEPLELERAGSASAGGVNPDVLWLQHLKRMATRTVQIGKRPMFWADIDSGAYIFNKYPGLAADLPPEAVAVPWFYGARADYSSLLKPFSKNRVPNFIATGIADWDSVAPNFATSFINIDGFLAAGRDAGSLGMVNTEWSDSAQALHRASLPAMAYGGAAAWQGAPMDRKHFFANYSRLVYPAALAQPMSAAFSELTDAETLMGKVLGGETIFRLWDDPLTPAVLGRVRPMKRGLKELRIAAENAEEHLLEASALSRGPSEQEEQARQAIQSLLLAARMVDYAGMKYLYALEIADNFSGLVDKPSKSDVAFFLGTEGSARNHSRVGDLIDQSGELEQDYQTEWLAQYRPYRLSAALSRWRAEQEYWRSFQQKSWEAQRAFKDGDPRPTLEQTRPRR